MRKFSIYIIIIASCFIVSKAGAQSFKLRGTVYDSTKTYPVISVSVLTTSGKGTITDLYGHYEIDVTETDSVWFSYLNKPTIKYVVRKIPDASHFDIAIHINVPMLKEVIVKQRNYKMDSIQNRIDYAKAFDWQKPKLQGMSSGELGSAAGFDLDAIIHMFQFRKNKSNAAFRERLLEEEREKFIDHRFNKALVRRLTNLPEDELTRFMVIYRPDYEFTLYSSDYDFQSYIKEAFVIHSKQKSF